MSKKKKKGPYIYEKLLLKVSKMEYTGQKKPIKTWARASVIAPEFVGYTFLVHNGKNFLPVFVTENMVGHKLGEFAPTRIFRRHGAHTEVSMTKT